ncbi:hypothetical protein K493DRAFT_406743 [Basidiobolus meristosporus CBS 931.73]|uniref:Uncharacterized protein n=1 Tax=Basidiobolus meristosporus CBS 931.73 TaxID=1314790 RepID=A0A1Y1XWB2_9FUNG|nr:hypothetical protein K493DRAFT_266377 [Basidiobolus meristosporus CBS 931.73]ORX97992.1 hypothetical protein K493DRAFT_406743 [Basidiobolus meristosporus CBS 931.73]|eukprot:ORX89965.1 hypothetical protein K493DRAFT_266377 [Basidiobolus meristosporus CBS 931.73]
MQKAILALQDEKESEKRRSWDINQQYLEKLHQLQKLQGLYDQLKRKLIASNLQQNIFNAQNADEASLVSYGEKPTKHNPHYEAKFRHHSNPAKYTTMNPRF